MIRVSDALWHELRNSPSFVPAEQLLIAFVGLYQGHAVFLELIPPKKRKRRKRK